MGNTDDTVYDFIVSDGRDTVRYTQDNIPANITAAFNTVSCEFVTVGGDPDAFTVEIIATNPCGLSRGFRTPIRVGRLPVADFSINPEPEICEEALHTFVNRSTEGVDIDATGCTDRLDTRWAITSVDGGIFNFESGNMFSDSIVVSFSGGEYNVTMTASNGCGADTKTETICVLTSPDSEIAPDRTEGCTSEGSLLDVDFINASNTIGACGPASSYTWSIGFDPGECGASPSWTQVDRTPLDSLDNPNVNDQDIRLRFDSAGIYTVYLGIVEK
jgi:PKD repeat protein